MVIRACVAIQGWWLAAGTISVERSPGREKPSVWLHAGLVEKRVNGQEPCAPKTKTDASPRAPSGDPFTFVAVNMQVSTSGLPSEQPYATEDYGSDTTFYVATSAADEPAAVVKPTAA